MLRKAVVFAAVFAGILLILAVLTIAPIDFSPWQDRAELAETVTKANQVSLNVSAGPSPMLAGWSKVNITPTEPMSLAGYGRRGPFVSVADSLFCRTVVLDNGNTKVAIISIDLLLFPAVVCDVVKARLMKEGYENVLFSATHTHSSFGNWEKTRGGQLVFGKYKETLTDLIVNKVIASVMEADGKKEAVRLAFLISMAAELVSNRLSPANGTTDPFIRTIVLKKNNGQMALITSFSGHATNLPSDDWALSNDYPGVLIDKLEHNASIDFAMFCAGMVGSHKINLDIPRSRARIEEAGSRLSAKIQTSLSDTVFYSDNRLGSAELEIAMPPSQLRITSQLRVRDWVFRYFFDPLSAHISAVQAGEITFVGMPCDFSGELSVNNQLDSLAESNGSKLFITSFNGDYVGYITEDGHYATCNNDEVRIMNWVGPGMGSYFTEIIKGIIRSEK